jgi:drug/metabolite transporter (DMT)-like permease
MTSAAVALAFASAFCFGAGLVLTQLGLRYLSPLSGAAIAIPSSTLLLICISPVALAGATVAWSAVAIFAAVGLLYPGAATLLTFAANRALGPVITATLGNLAPLFAVALAFVMLGEPLRLVQFGGLVAIVAGVVLLTAGHSAAGGRWRSWFLLLPLLAAAIRGFIQPVSKLGLEIWPSPFAASLTSYIVSAIVVITVARRAGERSERPARRPYRCARPTLAGTGLVGARVSSGQFVARAPLTGRLWFVGVGLCNGLAVLLLYAALARGPVALVSPLVATYPLVTVAGSALFLGRSDGGARLALAVALTVVGVALLLVG